MLTEKKVKFYMNDMVTEVRGEEGKVQHRGHCAVCVNTSVQCQASPDCRPSLQGGMCAFPSSWSVPRCVCVCVCLQVKDVVLKSGNVIPADVLIVGIGEYNTGRTGYRCI